MKVEEIFELIEKNYELMSPILANMINKITEKLIACGNSELVDDNGNKIIITNDNDEEIDEENYEILSRTENFLFNAFANLIKAKEIIGLDLDFAETALKNQYDFEMEETFEMYREFKNTEEILNDGEDDTDNEQEEGEEN